MKPKHTPGPWTWWAGSLIGTAENGEKSHIVKCEALGTANARLIAAAPKMLEALELAHYQVRNRLAELHVSYGPGGCETVECEAQLKIITQAIAKARGEQ